MSTESRELELYINNDGDLYRQQTTSILKNLATKKAKGIYNRQLAIKLFGYLVESGAKKYAREFGSPGQPWNKMFDVPTRRSVAESLAKSFEDEWNVGSYRDLAPKKYSAISKSPAQLDREIKQALKKK